MSKGSNVIVSIAEFSTVNAYRQRTGICEGWEIDIRQPGYLKLNL